MKFIRTLTLDVAVADLHAQLTIDRLPQFCASIQTVLTPGDSRGRVYCVWGEFDVIRELQANGVRFILPKCPNDLTWTIVRGGGGALTVCTDINNDHPDPDFAQSIERFVDDWVCGLQRLTTT